MAACGWSATVEFGGGLSSPTRLHLSLLGDLQSIVDFDAEVPDRAFEFGMSEEKLDGAEVPGPPNQRRFRATQGMRTVACRVKSNRTRQSPDEWQHALPACPLRL